MNVLAPVKSIMTEQLITVNPGDKLKVVKEVFGTYNIHHLPVVRYKQLVGLISKTDFWAFMRSFRETEEDRFVNEARLRAYKAEDLMTEGLAKLSPEDRINVALELFLVNRFHAIPVVEEDSNDLVGIVTTFDIIKALAAEEVTAEQIMNANK